MAKFYFERILLSYCITLVLCEFNGVVKRVLAAGLVYVVDCSLYKILQFSGAGLVKRIDVNVDP